MEEAFNPYSEWLGVQGGRRPGNYYELLGIKPYENDVTVIAQAADRLTARIRSIRPGPQVAEWQRLLDTVTGAKRCLLDPTAKAAYDAALRGQTCPAQPARPPSQGGTAPTTAAPSPPTAAARPAWQPAVQPPSQPPAPPTPPAPPAAVPLAVGATSPGDQPADFPRDGSHGGLAVPRTRARRHSARWSGAQFALGIVTVALLVVAGAFAHRLYQRHRETAAYQTRLSQANSEPSPPAGTSHARTQIPGPLQRPNSDNRSTTPLEIGPEPARRESESQEQPGPEKAVQPAAGPGPGEVPRPAGEGQPGAEPQPDGSLTPPSPTDDPRQQALKQALADARASMSKRDLAAARRHLSAAAGEAQTPQDRAEIDRLDALLSHLEEFWKGMSRVVAGLEAAEVLPVGDTYVAVVEAGPEEICIKVAGRLRTYKIDRMPSRLVQALANMRLGGDPATKVLVGAYFLVDADGDPARARQLWAEAAAGGVDIAALIPELDRWARASPSLGLGPPAAAERTPLPADRQKLQEAEQAVRERFKAEYDRATGAAGKSRLATVLLDAVPTTGDDLHLRLVLLREARDLAVAAGNAALACQAIDQIAGFHEVDLLEMKTSALVEAARRARGLSAQKQVAQTALELAGQAVDTREIEKASQLAEVALSAARKSSSRPLMQQAMLVVDEIEALSKQAEGQPGPTRKSAAEAAPRGND